jgi:hypothetical protein
MDNAFILPEMAVKGIDQILLALPLLKLACLYVEGWGSSLISWTFS